MLQCSLLVKKHCSNSNLNNGDGEAVGVGFWGVFFSSKIDYKEAIGDALRAFSSGVPNAKYLEPVWSVSSKHSVQCLNIGTLVSTRQKNMFGHGVQNSVVWKLLLKNPCLNNMF